MFTMILHFCLIIISLYLIIEYGSRRLVTVSSFTMRQEPNGATTSNVIINCSEDNNIYFFSAAA